MRILVISIFLFSSCMTTKTSIGSYKEETGEVYTFDKAKQFYLFWGLLPLGRSEPQTPTDGSCQVITKHRLGDFLVSVITVGILSSQSIIVKDKK